MEKRLHIRIPEELKDAATDLAHREGYSSLSTYVRVLLVAKLKETESERG